MQFQELLRVPNFLNISKLICFNLFNSKLTDLSPAFNRVIKFFTFNYLVNKKNNVINECYKKAEHYINLASNSLNIFQNSDEKEILKNLTSFSLERNF